MSLSQTTPENTTFLIRFNADSNEWDIRSLNSEYLGKAQNKNEAEQFVIRYCKSHYEQKNYDAITIYWNEEQTLW